MYSVIICIALTPLYFYPKIIPISSKNSLFFSVGTEFPSPLIKIFGSILLHFQGRPREPPILGKAAVRLL